MKKVEDEDLITTKNVTLGIFQEPYRNLRSVISLSSSLKCYCAITFNFSSYHNCMVFVHAPHTQVINKTIIVVVVVVVVVVVIILLLLLLLL